MPATFVLDGRGVASTGEALRCGRGDTDVGVRTMSAGNEAVVRLRELRDAYVREVNEALAEGRTEVVAELVERFTERAHEIAALRAA